MKKLLILTLALLMLCTAFVACNGDEPPKGESALVVVPADLDFIAIHGTDKTAYFDKNNQEALDRFLEELRATRVFVDEAVSGEDFNMDHYYDINIYCADGSMRLIAVDKNGLIDMDGSFFRLDEGVLSYERIGEYLAEYGE